jgi:hypothetical protein
MPNENKLAPSGYMQIQPTCWNISRMLVWAEQNLISRDKSGDVKGTIRNDLRYHFAPNDVRRHRLISISYISLLPCHGTARGNGREPEGTRGNEAVPEALIMIRVQSFKLRGRSSSG